MANRQTIKQAAKDAVTSLLLQTPLRHFSPRTDERKVVIFTLHRVACAEYETGDADLDLLERALIALRNLRVPVLGLQDVLDGVSGRSTLPSLSVCFTIDDGYWDQAELIVPVLLRHGVTPTVFLITGFLDGQIWPWDARVHEFFRQAASPSVEVQFGSDRRVYDLRSPASRRRARESFLEWCKTLDDTRREEAISSLARALGVDPSLPLPKYYRSMSWDQARQLEKLGVQFGSHSVSHCVFSRATTEAAQTELENSWRRIKQELNSPSEIFAWPIGRRCDFGGRDVAIASKVGYRGYVDVFVADNLIPSSGLPVGEPLLHRHGFPDSHGEFLRTTFGLSFDAVTKLFRHIVGGVRHAGRKAGGSAIS